MPATRGWTSRSRASRPSRRRTNPARLSSTSSSRRGMNRSISIRSLPRQDRIGVASSGPSRRGAIITNPSGTGISRPLRTTNDRRWPGSVAIRRSDNPSRSQRSRPQGLFVMNESGPPSRVKPSNRSVQITPPGRSLASNTFRSTDRRKARARSWIRCAVARPERPPPITITRSDFFASLVRSPKVARSFMSCPYPDAWISETSRRTKNSDHALAFRGRPLRCHFACDPGDHNQCAYT